MSDSPLGRFSWYDLMTSDPDAAKAFYTEIAGWGTDVWEGGEQPYMMFTNNQKPLGGVMSLPPVSSIQFPPVPLPVWVAKRKVYVPSVTSTGKSALVAAFTVINMLVRLRIVMITAIVF